MMSIDVRPSSRTTPSAPRAPVSPVRNRPSRIERRRGRRRVAVVPGEHLRGADAQLAGLARRPPRRPVVVDDVDGRPPAARARRRPGRAGRRRGSTVPCRSRSSRSVRGSSGRSPLETRPAATPAGTPSRWSRGAARGAPAAQRARCGGAAPRHASISFAYIVGTAMNSVASANPSQTAAASKGANRTSAPAQSAPSSATMRPCVWCRGSTCSRRSSRRQRQASSSAATVAASAAWLRRTPFGRPVVPEV